VKPQTQAALEAATESTMLAFGLNAQMVKTCEELGELTTALCKRLNGSPVSDAQIVDEVADVLIMANQMRHTFGADAVDDRIVYKLNRTMEFIRTKKGQSHESETHGDSEKAQRTTL
jgi:NTP pyrophosphatase (non-canonical NTP hydrolase)